MAIGSFKWKTGVTTFGATTALATLIFAAACGLTKQPISEEADKAPAANPGEATSPSAMPEPGPGPGDSSNPGAQDAGTLQSQVDLTGIIGFALTEATANTSLSLQGSGSNIFGFDTAGQSRPLRFSSGMANFKKIIPTPKAIFLIPGDYSQIAGATGQTCRFLVMTIADGRLYCVTEFGIQPENHQNKSLLQASRNGDLVTAEGWENGGWSKLYRMDFSVPGEMKVTKIYDKEGYPEQWGANYDGDVFVQYAANQGRLLRILKADGSFDPLGAGEYVRCLNPGKGSYGNDFFYLFSSGGTNQWLSIHKNAQNIYEQSVVKDIQSADNLGFIFDGCEATLIEETKHYYAMTQRDNDGSLGDPSQAWNGAASIVELTPGATPAVRRLSVTGMRRVSRIIRVGASADRLIIVGENALGSGLVVGLNTVTGVNTILLGTGRFVITDAYADGAAVRFMGERQSDSAIVSSAIENLDSEADPTTTVLSVQKPKQIIPLRY